MPNYGIELYSLILFFTSIYQHCVAPVGIASMPSVKAPVIRSAQVARQTNNQRNAVNHRMKNQFANGHLTLTTSQNRNFEPIKSATNDVSSFGFGKDDQSLITFDEHISDLVSDYNKFDYNTRDGIALINLKDIEEANRYIEEQIALYKKTDGNEGFDLEKISENILKKKKQGSKVHKTFTYLKEDFLNGAKNIFFARIKLVNSLNEKVKVFLKNNNFKGERKEEFEEIFKNIATYAPNDEITKAFLDIPHEGIQLLLTIFAGILNDLQNKQAVDLITYKDMLNKSSLDDNTKNKNDKFFRAVENSFKKLPTYLTENFATLFKNIAAHGLTGLKYSLIIYLTVWENATPEDQQKMAETFPKLAFFYNDVKSMMMNNYALHSVNGNIFYKIGLLVLLKMIFLNKPKYDGKLYEELKEKLEEDFRANKELIDKIGSFFSQAKFIVGSPEEE